MQVFKTFIQISVAIPVLNSADEEIIGNVLVVVMN